MKPAPVIILGAGPTGLSAAYQLGDKALLLERETRVGGWCRSLSSDGFTFDMAGHIMFSNDPYVHELYTILLGSNVHWQEREAWVYTQGVHTRYPFQGALHGLPPSTIEECVMGAIEARHGDWRRPLMAARAERAARNGHASDGARLGPEGTSAGDDPPVQRSPDATGPSRSRACETVEDCCGDGALDVALTDGQPGIAEPRDFEEFIYRAWGAGIARHFAIPYNQKLWTVPLHEMETSWLNGRVPLPDLGEMIHGALSPVARPMGPNARFGYPLHGGFQALMDGFLPHLRGPLHLGAEVVAVSPRRREVTLANGKTLRYEALLSTLPLPELIRRMGEEPPRAIRESAERLRHVSVRCVNLGIGREKLSEKHWIYYPGDTVFHRIFVQGNASPGCNPPGGFGLTCEISYSPWKPLPCEGDALIARCIADARRVGMIRDDDPVWTANQVDLPCAYVVYDHARSAHVQRIRRWLLAAGIVLAGRYSEWEYYNSDHAFLAGRKAAGTIETILARSAPTPKRLAREPSLGEAQLAPIRRTRGMSP